MVVGTKRLHIGIFLIAATTLMYEILLTRVFSVMLWYHFAFMAISIALFGMTLGATLVYILPEHFRDEKVGSRLSLYSFLFSFSTAASFIVYTTLPTLPSVEGVLSVGLVLLSMYIVVPIPFVMSGIVVGLILSRCKEKISTLYAADLIGAAIGCIALIVLISLVSVPSAVIMISALAALAAFSFAPASYRVTRRASLFLALIFLLLALSNEFAGRDGKTLLSPRYVKGHRETPPLYEKWNSFSRVTVHPDTRTMRTFGWGLSDIYDDQTPKDEKMILIDADAGTPLTRFSGDRSELTFLGYDVVNLAHYIRRNARVFVVGVGGGRDILSALAFQQKSVTGLEVNNLIVEALTGPYGDFTGHLDRIPQVTIVNDEARSYIARSTDQFDIIQISLIDTWAATAAGAFVLAENSLYTKEAWHAFFDHLSSTGVLSVSRWYFEDQPGEIYRAVALASEVLRERGVAEPRDHIMVIRKQTVASTDAVPPGVGTLLISRAPFTGPDVARIESIARTMRFDVMLTPTLSRDRVFNQLVAADRPDAFLQSFPIRIDPPTDDQPFFFNMLRMRDFANGGVAHIGPTSFNMKAISTLVILLFITIVLSVFFIVIPLLITIRHLPKRDILVTMTLYFASIGLGFMLVEISLMQRLIVYLGNPVYGLSVILFALLLSSGLGSYVTRTTEGHVKKITRRGLALLACIIVIVAIVGFSTPPLMHLFAAATLPIRILLSGGVVFLVGIVLGTAFPMGMKVVGSLSPQLSAFVWGVNGALSVVSSVLAVVVSISLGITATMLIGAVFYVCAFLTLLFVHNRIVTH